jgi:hypothetical protein
VGPATDYAVTFSVSDLHYTYITDQLKESLIYVRAALLELGMAFTPKTKAKVEVRP